MDDQPKIMFFQLNGNSKWMKKRKENEGKSKIVIRQCLNEIRMRQSEIRCETRRERKWMKETNLLKWSHVRSVRIEEVEWGSVRVLHKIVVHLLFVSLCVCVYMLIQKINNPIWCVWIFIGFFFRLKLTLIFFSGFLEAEFCCPQRPKVFQSLIRAEKIRAVFLARREAPHGTVSWR